MRYAKAVTDEREKYWRERKAICEGRITARSADGTLMAPTQAFEDAQARYVDACKPTMTGTTTVSGRRSPTPRTPTIGPIIKTRPSKLSNKPSC